MFSGSGCGFGFRVRMSGDSHEGSLPTSRLNTRMPMSKVRPIVKVEDVVLTSEGYHVYDVCTCNEHGHKVASVHRRFSEFCKLDTVLQKSIKVSTIHTA